MHFALLAWPARCCRIQAPALTRLWRHADRFAHAPADWRPTMLVAAAALLCPVAGHAAGGHHAVDDAAIVDPGRCQVETWLEHGRQHRLQHVGPACHLLGVELGVNLDRSVTQGEPVLRGAGLQIKWAQDMQPGFSWGWVWSATWQNTAPRFAGQSLLLPLSWSPREDLTVHVNLGRDVLRRAADRSRYGVALEWQPTAQWQGLIEHWDDGLRAQHRLGVRHLLSDALSLDLSRAQPRGAAREAWWSLGLNWTFAR